MSYNGSTIDSKPVCGGSIPSILEFTIDLVIFNFIKKFTNNKLRLSLLLLIIIINLYYVMYNIY